MENNFKGYNKNIGILLTNLGTPDSPDKKGLKKYLNQFLLDTRVVDLPRFFWVPLLKVIILNIRPKKSAKLYKSIWKKEGSPLMVYSKNILNKIDVLFNSEDTNVHVELGMRYGNPAIERAMESFKEKNINKILVFPLYPQAGSPTTASTFDAISNYLKNKIWMPNIRFISGYHDHPAYISSLVSSIKKSFDKNGKPDQLIISFHGMPERYLKNGDPYYCFCHKTARLLAESLNLEDHEYKLAFQSRFGTEEWLKPYLDDVLDEAAKSSKKNIQIISPGFSVDCLETLEEINIQYKKVFKENGGGEFTYIPCLNDDEDHINMIQIILKENLINW